MPKIPRSPNPPQPASASPRDFCRKTARELKTFWKSTRKYFLIISVILLVSYFAIFRANFLYVDDMDRAIDGYRGWGGFSRYTSEILSIFIHANPRLGDISPLPQILSILILSLVCCLLLYFFKIRLFRQKIKPLDIAAVILLALCPYFLSCMSYKFDSPYMALSILASIVPFFFWDFSRKTFLIATSLGCLLMCITYQAASGIFPVLLALFTFISIFLGGKPKEILKKSLPALLTFLLTLLVFSLILMRPVPENFYVSNTLPSIPNLLPTILSNLSTYYHLIFTDFQPLWLVLTLLIFALFPILVVLKSKKSRRLKNLLLSTAVLIFTLIAAFGVYPCFEKTLTEPRAMYGFGVALALVALLVSSLLSYKNPSTKPQTSLAKSQPHLTHPHLTHPRLAQIRLRLTKAQSLLVAIPIFALAYCFIVFANLYGNSLTAQREWTNFHANLIADELKDLDIIQSQETVALRLSGSIGHTLEIDRYATETKTNILTRLVPIALEGNNQWGIGYLRRFGLDNVIYLFECDPNLLPEYTLESDNYYHSVYTKDTDIIVVIK